LKQSAFLLASRIGKKLFLPSAILFRLIATLQTVNYPLTIFRFVSAKQVAFWGGPMKKLLLCLVVLLSLGVIVASTGCSSEPGEVKVEPIDPNDPATAEPPIK
jgi:hypothetical protein